MSAEARPPQEHPNFSRGLLEVSVPEYPHYRGKVRDVFENGDRLAIVTTDRVSTFDAVVGTVPQKGEVLNRMSAFWFNATSDIVPNHVIATPHPNVTISDKADATLPIEFVIRRYLARSDSGTSIYNNYFNRNKREIYGISFPEDLKPNQRFDEPLITPTTKAIEGHDEMITAEKAKEIVDTEFGRGTWGEVARIGQEVFSRGEEVAAQAGLLIADSKFEFGIKDNHIILIDELFTPDSSRYWEASTYGELFDEGKDPENFDKEIMRRAVKAAGYNGEGEVPEVPQSVIDQMAAAYVVPFRRITGQQLSPFLAREVDIVRVVRENLGAIAA